MNGTIIRDFRIVFDFLDIYTQSNAFWICYVNWLSWVSNCIIIIEFIVASEAISITLNAQNVHTRKTERTPSNNRNTNYYTYCIRETEK